MVVISLIVFYLTLQKIGFHFSYLVVAYFRQSERGHRAKKSKQETPVMAMGWGLEDKHIPQTCILVHLFAFPAKFTIWTPEID